MMSTAALVVDPMFFDNTKTKPGSFIMTNTRNNGRFAYEVPQVTPPTQAIHSFNAFGFDLSFLEEEAILQSSSAVVNSTKENDSSSDYDPFESVDDILQDCLEGDDDSSLVDEILKEATGGNLFTSLSSITFSNRQVAINSNDDNGLSVDRDMFEPIPLDEVKNYGPITLPCGGQTNTSSHEGPQEAFPDVVVAEENNLCLHPTDGSANLPIINIEPTITVDNTRVHHQQRPHCYQYLVDMTSTGLFSFPAASVPVSSSSASVVSNTEEAYTGSVPSSSSDVASQQDQDDCGNSVSSSSGSSTDNQQHCPKFRDYQTEQWSERFDELVNFFKQHGHSSVPHTDQSNKCLARWVKRQRYQHKLRLEGKPSAMTDERIQLLEDLDFVWDSHGAAWEDRLRELDEFKAQHKHCNVPSNYKGNSSLASWTKCQRRQYRLWKEGKKANITLDRIQQLESMGFQFNLRRTVVTTSRRALKQSKHCISL
jgi:hypothetical protein